MTIFFDFFEHFAASFCVLVTLTQLTFLFFSFFFLFPVTLSQVIDVSDERQRGAIMRYVKENIVQLRRYTYGKHIIVRLEKITNEKF